MHSVTKARFRVVANLLEDSTTIVQAFSDERDTSRLTAYISELAASIEALVALDAPLSASVGDRRREPHPLRKRYYEGLLARQCTSQMGGQRTSRLRPSVAMYPR